MNRSTPRTERRISTFPPIERLHYIAKLLRTGERFNAASIAQHFETSAKTAGRDLAFLRDRLGYDFFYDPPRWRYVLRSAPEPVL